MSPSAVITCATSRRGAEPLSVLVVAGRLQITLTTARTHLAHIFEKTGTRRQAEVVRLILQSAGGIDQ